MISSTKKLNCAMGILCLFSAIRPLPGYQPITDAGASQTNTVSPVAGLLPIPQPSPSTDLEVRRQVDDAWSRFQSISQKKAVRRQDLADAYGQLGMVYHAYGFVAAAAACYQNAHSLSPAEAGWPYYAGRLYQDEGDNRDAIAYFKMAQEVRPDDVPTLVNLGQTYQADGQADLAEKLFREALKIDPSHAAALAGLGEIAVSKGEFPLAIRSLESALKLQPEATTLHYPLAMAYRKTGDVTNALAHLQKKGTGKPVIPDPLMDKVAALKRGQRALWVQGNKALAEGRFADAISAYREMVKTSDPSDAVPRIHLGIAMAQSGDLKGAVEQFQEVCRITHGSPIAEYNLGVLSLQLKSEREAREHFVAAVALDPGFKLAHFQLANVLMRNGQFSDAVPHYAKAMELGLDNEFIRLMRAMALVRTRQYAEARAQLEEGVAARPESNDLKLALARLLAACPDKTLTDGPRSRQLVSGLLKSNSSPDLDLLETYGMALAAVGKFPEAANLQARMISDLEKMNRHEVATELKSNLALYQRGRTCDLPWRNDDPVFSPQPGRMVLFVPQPGVKRPPEQASPLVDRAATGSLQSEETHDYYVPAAAKTDDVHGGVAESHQSPTLRPDYPEAEMELGSTLSQTGDIEGAIVAFRTAVRQSPTLAKAHTELGRLYRRTGNIAGALVEFQTAVDADPNSSEAHINLGQALRQDGQPDRSIAEFRRAVALDGNSFAGLKNLAEALEDQNNWTAAIEIYRRMVILQPNSGGVHGDLGYALKRGDDLSAAAEELRTAVTLSPGLAPAHFYLGEVLTQTGDSGGALREYEKAARLNTEDPEYSYKYGVALSKVRPQDADMELRRAIELDPRNPDAHRSLGMLLRRTGEQQASAAEFQRALELSQEADKRSDAHVHRDTGLQYLRKNNPVAAITEFKFALTADPDSPDGDFLLAVALGMAGRSGEAQQEFATALRKKPSAPEVHFNFGVFLGRQGDFRGAARELRSVLALRPGYPQAHCLLANALSHLGDLAASAQELKLAQGLGPCVAEVGRP